MFQKSKKRISIPILSVLLISLGLSAPACSGRAVDTSIVIPDQTWTHEVTRSPTQPDPIIPLRTPSPAIESPGTPATSAFFTQDFTGEFIGWKYYFQGNANAPENSSYSLKDGRLVFDMNSVNSGLYLIYQDYSYVDVQISVRSENIGTSSSISLVCGYSEARGWYESNITSQGIYTLRRFDENGNITVLKQGGSKSIRVGQDSNDYTITCKASQSMSLSINEKDIIIFEDYKIPVGRTGIAVWASELRPIKVEVDHIKLDNPQ